MKQSRFLLLVTAVILAIATSCSEKENVVLPCYAGSWQLVSYCGESAEIDLHIQFKTNGNFIILQRNGSVGFSEYKGRYTADKESCTISGTYNDGEKWACDYVYELNLDNELVLTSTTDSAEVSVYKSAKMPTAGITNVVCNTEVANTEVADVKKPL